MILHYPSSPPINPPARGFFLCQRTQTVRAVSRRDVGPARHIAPVNGPLCARSVPVSSVGGGRSGEALRCRPAVSVPLGGGASAGGRSLRSGPFPRSCLWAARSALGAARLGRAVAAGLVAPLPRLTAADKGPPAARGIPPVTPRPFACAGVAFASLARRGGKAARLFAGGFAAPGFSPVCLCRGGVRFVLVCSWSPCRSEPARHIAPVSVPGFILAVRPTVRPDDSRRTNALHPPTAAARASTWGEPLAAPPVLIEWITPLGQYAPNEPAPHQPRAPSLSAGRGKHKKQIGEGQRERNFHKIRT